MEHRNFVENQTLEVDVVESSAGINVCLIQSASSMYFQFGMTPEQARSLSADLVATADKVERMLAARAAA